MTKLMKRNVMLLGAGLFTVTMMAAGDAHASNFSSIGQNVISSISSLPSLLSGLAYMFGILLAVLGVMKIKDHVENPGNVALKDGAIRLAAGGALFAIPIVLEAAYNTVGSSSANVSAASLTAISFTAGG